MSTQVGKAYNDADVEALLPRVRWGVKQILRFYNIPPEDAEDLVQEAFSILIAKWNEATDKEGYLLGILQNRCIAYWRKKRSRVVSYCDKDKLESLAKPRQPSQLAEDLHRDLFRAFAMLGETQRKVIILRVILGHGPQDVAKMLGCRTSTIRKSLGRSIKRLRLALGLQPASSSDALLDTPD